VPRAVPSNASRIDCPRISFTTSRFDPKCEPNPNLLLPLAHHERQHTVDTRDDQHHCQCRRRAADPERRPKRVSSAPRPQVKTQDRPVPELPPPPRVGQPPLRPLLPRGLAQAKRQSQRCRKPPESTHMRNPPLTWRIRLLHRPQRQPPWHLQTLPPRTGNYAGPPGGNFTRSGPRNLAAGARASL
jgi:hypothetical protein